MIWFGGIFIGSWFDLATFAKFAWFKQENKFELGAQNRKTLLTCDLPEVQFLASLTELESKKKLTRKKNLKTLFRTSIQLYLAAMSIPKEIS